MRVHTDMHLTGTVYYSLLLLLRPQSGANQESYSYITRDRGAF